MKSFKTLVLLLISLALFCSSCATILYGRKQKVFIDSKPQGASVHIGGKPVGNTPVVINESPRKPMTVVFSYPGYEDKTYTVNNKYKWGLLLLDVPFTYGPVNIPFAIDMFTMAPYRFTEDSIRVDFTTSYVVPELFTQIDSLHREAEKSEEEKKEARHIEIEKERRVKLMDRQLALRSRFVIDSTNRVRKKIRTDSLRKYNAGLLNEFKNSITWQCTALLVKEYNFTYHRTLYKGVTLGVEVGYKKRSPSKREHNNMDNLDINGPVTEIMLMSFSESVYLGLATKIPIPKLMRGITYVSLVGFVRNTNYDHATITWANQIDKNVVAKYYDSVKVEQNAIGAKFLFGIRPIIKVSEWLAFEFDVYAGVGLRMVKNNIYHYEESRQIVSSTSPVVSLKSNRAEVTSSITPSLQLGFRMGFRF